MAEYICSHNFCGRGQGLNPGGRGSRPPRFMVVGRKGRNGVVGVRGRFPDNSAQDNSARTIRRWTIWRGQFGATIRLGQFGAKYDFNFIENSAFIQQYSYHQSRFYFSNIIFINPASITAIDLFFSPILFGIRHYELGLLIDEKIVLKWKRD